MIGDFIFFDDFIIYNIIFVRLSWKYFFFYFSRTNSLSRFASFSVVKSEISIESKRPRDITLLHGTIDF
jgi:hypothetical protein